MLADPRAGTKICGRHGCEFKRQPQSISAFHRNRSTADGLQTHCQSCWKRIRKAKGYDRRAWQRGGKGTARLARIEARRMAWSLAALKEARRRREPLLIEQLLAHLAYCWGGMNQFAAAINRVIERGQSSHKARWAIALVELLPKSRALTSRSKADRDDEADRMTDDQLDQRIETTLAKAADARIAALVASGHLRWTKKKLSTGD